MKRYKHKYVFYFYPKLEADGALSKGFFRFFGRVKDGKECAKTLKRNFDYEKLF